MIAKLTGLLMIVAMTSGCSSTIAAYKNRSISKHGIAYKGKFEEGQVFVMTGERRMAVVFPKDPKFKFCPESLPEVASAIGAASSLSAATGKATVGLRDEVVQSLIQTSNRTENAELFRQWSFMMCSAWAQGANEKTETNEKGEDVSYWGQLQKMTDALAKIMQNNSNKSITINATGLSVQTTPTPTTPTAPAIDQKKDEKKAE